MKRLAATAAFAALLIVGAASPADAKAKKPHRPSAACVAALDSAERVIHVGGDFARAIRDYFKEMQQASRTAVASGDSIGFVNDLTAATERLTPKIGDLTTQVNTETAIYNPNALKCRAGR